MRPARTSALAELIAFGEAAERSTQWCVDVGGFLVPGEEDDTDIHLGKERVPNGSAAEGAREEAGPTTGSWEGRRAPWSEASADSATYALGALRTDWQSGTITVTEFDELEAIFPDVRVTFSSSGSVFLGMTVGVFKSLPYRARLVMEVPRPCYAPVLGSRDRIGEIATWSLPSVLLGNRGSQVVIPPRGVVPPLRTWASWSGGSAHGMLIVSHHRNPDWSICACMHHQWLRGIDPLVDYASLCVSWIGKVAYELEFGRYPGRQHLPEWIRVERKPDEFCGCDRYSRPYHDCCRDDDLSIDAAELTRRREHARRSYFTELALQKRPRTIPSLAWPEDAFVSSTHLK